MVILSSLPAGRIILTPQMIHTQQKYLCWLQRKNVPSLGLQVPDHQQDNKMTQNADGCSEVRRHFEAAIQEERWAG